MKNLKKTLAISMIVATLLTACSHNTQVTSPTLVKSMNKQVSVLDLGTHKIHTFYGISNSHIIESKDKLVMVDAQFNKKLAMKLKAYIQTLNKPLETIILSHAHPDHWFGYEVFENAKIVTTANVVKDLDKRGMFYIKKMKPKFAKDIPDTVVKPEGSVVLGKQNLNGLDVILEEHQEHEAHNSILIKIPKYGIMIGQDLFYNNMHLVASERTRNKNWAKILESFEKNEAKHYKTILVGHGQNTGTEVFQQDITYLNALEEILHSGANKKETKAQLIEQFPTKKGQGFINITVGNLFSKH